MGNASDAFDSAKNIASNSVKKSGDIAESAGDILKGDIKEGAAKMASSISDIATTATTDGVNIAASAASAVGGAMKKVLGKDKDEKDDEES